MAESEGNLTADGAVEPIKIENTSRSVVTTARAIDWGFTTSTTVRLNFLGDKSDVEEKYRRN